VAHKTFILAAISFLLGVGASYAASYVEAPFVPLSAEAMGRGGSMVADTTGYDSFFYNPAGFSRENGSFTLGDATAWMYSRPDQALTLGQQLLAGTSTTAGIASFLNDQVTTGGVGIGASAGIGYVGNGLGLGTVLIVDSLLNGPVLLGASGNMTGTIGFIGGLSVPFDVLGFKIHVGGDIRPMIRVHVPITNTVAVGMLNALISNGDVFAAMNSAAALYGVGIGLDVGTIAELGWFTAGLSIRDLAGTQFRYSSSTFGVLENSLISSVEFPTSGASTGANTYTIPMDVAVGVGVHPDMGTFNNVLDPSINVDLHDVIGALAGQKSIWTLLHIGAELKFLSFLTLRGGLDEGYLTAGLGVKLAFLDLNVAVFTQELGQYVGDTPNSGATLSLAIRW